MFKNQLMVASKFSGSIETTGLIIIIGRFGLDVRISIEITFEPELWGCQEITIKDIYSTINNNWCSSMRERLSKNESHSGCHFKWLIYHLLISNWIQFNGNLRQSSVATTFKAHWHVAPDANSELIEHPVFSITHSGHLTPVCFRIVVEVSCVPFITDFWNDGRSQLFVVDLLPINRLEPPERGHQT